MNDIFFFSLIIIWISAEKIKERLNLTEDEVGILLFKTQQINDDFECYFKTFEDETEKLILYINQSKTHYRLHLSNRSQGTFRADNDFQLIIHKVKINDSGYYRCGTSQYKFYIKLLVESTPILKLNGLVYINNVTIEDNKNIIITCEMYGDYSSQLYISNNGAELTGYSSTVWDGYGTKITKTVTSHYTLYDTGNNLKCFNSRRKILTDGEEIKEILNLNEDEEGILFYANGKHIKNGPEYECYFKKFESQPEKLVVYINKSTIQLSRHLSNRSNGTLTANNDFKLIMYKVKINDSGEYRCGNLQHSLTIRLFVESIPVLMVNGNIIVNNTAFEDNKYVTITCKIYGKNTSELKISKNGIELTGNSSTIWTLIGYKRTITVTSLFNLTDLGTILECCNNRKQSKTTTLIDITVRPELNITKKESFIAGKEVNLTCTSRARPEANVYWTMNGQNISNSFIDLKTDGKLYIKMHTIKFIPIKEDNNKTLSCTAEDYNDTSIKHQLKVLYGPANVFINPSPMNVKNGFMTNESFICKGDGDPPLMFRWFFKNHIIANRSKFGFNRLVTRKDHGIYDCEAFNDINSTIKSTFLNVSTTLTVSNLPVLAACTSICSILLLVTFIILVLSHKSRKKERQRKYEFKDQMTQSRRMRSSMEQSPPNPYYSEIKEAFNVEPQYESADEVLITGVPYIREPKKTEHQYEMVNLREQDLPAITHANIIEPPKIEEHKYEMVNLTKQDLPPIPDLNVSDLTYIAAGNFAIVYSGTCLIEENKTKSRRVAVKIPKDFINWLNQKEKSFCCEIELHYRLPPHVNVIGCFGQILMNGIYGMVLEFAGKGTLKELLQRLYHENLKKLVQKANNSIDNLNFKCMKFSREVASGMAHIAKHKIVHRDLAARNILLDSNDVCKISDFGLSRDISVSCEYNMSSNDPIPIRWLSPESLFYNVYSEKSDIWSFGILLWEIIALGGTPYPNIKTGSEVKQALQSGYRMSPPKHCGPELYDIMKMCWKEQQNERPTFDSLEETLCSYLSDKKEYIKFENFDKTVYENINPKIYREKLIN